MNQEKKQTEKHFRCTPAGIPMTVSCEGKFVTGISFGWEENFRDAGEKERYALAEEVEKQLEQYFHGRRRTFEFPLKMKGTEFQKQVWNELLKIPYGETRSYSEIAQNIQNPRAVRAVGMANHRNPLAIVIPCHRVIGKDGSMTGYAGGLERKKMLLELESRYGKEQF